MRYVPQPLYIFIYVAQQPKWDLDYLTVEITHNSHNPLLSGIRTRDPSSQAASDLRLRPQGRRYRREPQSVTGVKQTNR